MEMGFHLDNWHDKAGVRTAPRRMLDEVDAGQVFFPASLMPYIDHPLIARLADDQRRRLSIRHLYMYLISVANIESKVINPGTLLLAEDSLGLELSPATRGDAWKIYCDEAFHALSSLDLVHQVENVTGTRAGLYSFAPTMNRLELAAAPLERTAPGLGRLLEVVVFETVITSLLDDIPRDLTVVKTIREVVADHARDERTHHAFYSIFFDRLWATLDRPVREQVARVLPDLIDACLSTDMPMTSKLLTATDLSESLSAQDVEQVLAETYSPEFESASIRQSARRTLAMFTDHDVLEYPGAVEAFSAAGLLET